MSEGGIEEIFCSKGRVKVLKAILANGEINVTQIIKITRLNYKVVSKHLKYLKDAGLIEEIAIGRIKVYRPNWLNPKVRYIDELIRSIEEV